MYHHKSKALPPSLVGLLSTVPTLLTYIVFYTPTLPYDHLNVSYNAYPILQWVYLS